MRPFEISVRLPPGPLLVEASAGTGKTWSIARLVARLLAEDPLEGGPPPTLEQILVVTFTDAATTELRDRVRLVLIEASALLARLAEQCRTGAPTAAPQDPGFAVLGGSLVAPIDGAVPVWTPHPAEVLAGRAARLKQAVIDFDTAAISTIHGFCQNILKRMAFESDAALDDGLLENADAILEQVVDDWLARTLVPADLPTYGWLTGPAAVTRGRLLDVARLRTSVRDAEFLPAEDPTWRQGLVDRQRQAAALLARWEGPEGAELWELLRTALVQGVLHGGSYPQDQLGDRWEAHLAWLRGGAVTAPPSPWFSQSHVWAKTNGRAKGKPSPEHALLAAVDALLARELPVHAPLCEFAAFAAQEYAEQLRRVRAMVFDDLLQRVSDGLKRPALVDALRRQFKVALIDEFQDTDALQWTIFRRVFAESRESRLVLIGDPKQAIYSFRNADVAVYAAARQTVPAPLRQTMGWNFRSDQPLIEALNRSLGAEPNLFLTDQIRYEPVQSRLPARLHEADGQPVPPLMLRWFDGQLAGEGPHTALSNSEADRWLPDAVARDIAQELRRGRQVGEMPHQQPLSPRHLAVLVATNRQAAAIHRALGRVGVPAVIAQSGSVFDSVEAAWLQLWLEALSAARRDQPARRLVATPLYGFSGEKLLSTQTGEDPAAQADWLAVQEGLARQAQLLERPGVAAALSQLLDQPSPPDGLTPLARLAALPDGERRLTNLRHLGELLDAEALQRHAGARGLLRWLRNQCVRGHKDREAAELRLESDADTVRVLTMHKAKGLEFPVVYLPFLHDGRVFRGRSVSHQPLRFHRPDREGLTVDLRGLGAADPADARQAWLEGLQERQRLLYVAMTRAEHRIVLYAGPVTGRTEQGGVLPPQDLLHSPLGLLIWGQGEQAGRLEDLGRLGRVNDAAAGQLMQGAAAWLAGLGALAEFSELEYGLVPGPPLASLAPTSLVPPEPMIRLGLDQDWRRESYTGLVRHRKGQILQDFEPEAPQDYRDDADDTPQDQSGELEPEVAPPMPAPAFRLEKLESPPGARALRIPDPPDQELATDPEIPMRGFPGGTEAGKWVHAVLEQLVFVAEPRPRDPTMSIAQLVRGKGMANGFVRSEYDAALIAALPAMLSTSLGPRLDGRCLADMPEGDRLNELGFDLPIGPGDRWRNHRAVRGPELAQVLGADRPDLPLPPGYLAHVRDMKFRPLAGYLTGAIDLVFRLPVQGRSRWFIADYKTNTLGPRREEGGRVLRSQPGHYATPWMAAEIARKHYYLQYLLYLTALHRFLGSRLPSYDYERDVGGAVYLFVRGMLGPQTGSDRAGTNGVFVDKPPAHLIEALSQLFARVEEEGA